jgi:hypothetical protein
MNTLKSLLIAGTLGIACLSTTGCTTLRPSRIPEMIQRLDVHDFDTDEKQTISALLHYINYLENEL